MPNRIKSLVNYWNQVCHLEISNLNIPFLSLLLDSIYISLQVKFVMILKNKITIRLILFYATKNNPFISITSK